MKHLFKFTFIITLFISCNISSGSIDSKAKELDKNKNKIYKNIKYKYSIEYPHNWTELSTNTQEEVYLSGPQIDSGLFKTDGAVSIMASKREKPFTLEESFIGNIRYIEKTSKNFKGIGTSNLTINGIKMKVAKFQVDEFITMMSIQYYFKKSNISFVFGGTIPSQEMGKYEKIYFDIIKTFKFTEE
ncbi:MAG: hypothetical protein ABF242_09280 [Flavobacteriales bacterium]